AIAHGAGVVSPLDSFRLGGAIEPNRVLQLDGDFLDRTYAFLTEVVRESIETVRGRLLSDFFEVQRSWADDALEFSALFPLGQVLATSAAVVAASEADF